ncbi:MAG: twin-arginine translocase TatA/TatE family subunit [Pontixanthobacter sp.]
MGIGWPQLLIVALVVLLLFGRGRISEMMGDFGKGIKSFKSGLNDDDAVAPKSTARIEPPVHDAKPVSEGLTEDQIKTPTDKS